MTNQRTAVFNAVLAVVGEINGPVELDKSQKEQVHAILVSGFINGDIELKGRETKSPEWIKKYVPGLVNNWLRKDKALNGGTTYQPKNPGSRMGSGDEPLKAMKALLAQTVDEDARQEIQKAIDERVALLRPKVELNVEALPEHLRRYAPQS